MVKEYIIPLGKEILEETGKPFIKSLAQIISDGILEIVKDMFK